MASPLQPLGRLVAILARVAAQRLVARSINEVLHEFQRLQTQAARQRGAAAQGGRTKLNDSESSVFGGGNMSLEVILE